MTHMSLFSGIGGLDIAAEMAGFRTVGQCEWADYPTKVLEKHWPDVPRWRDIRTLTKESFYERTGLRTVDVISGGFPCQPFSIAVAGKRRGKEDDRYLWPEMLRVIKELRPRWVVGENVAGIVSMALDQVLADLEAAGYEARAVIIPACAVDAPHRRDRCAIIANCKSDGERLLSIQSRETRPPDFNIDGGCKTVAHANHAGLQGREQHGTSDASGEKEPQRPVEQCSQIMADTERVGLRKDGDQSAYDRQRNDTAHREERETKLCQIGCGGGHVPHTASQRRNGAEPFAGETGRSRLADRYWRDTQPGLGGMVDGIPGWLDRGMSSPGYWLSEPEGVPRVATGIKDRVNRLKCLGNAVVPQQFYPIFQAIADTERMINL